MKSLILLFPASLLLVACNSRLNTLPGQEWESGYSYSADKSIDTLTQTIPSGTRLLYQVKDSGDKLVFTYTYATGMNNEVYDDEYQAMIQFAVDKDVDNFYYKDAVMKEHFANYGGGGAWGGYQQVGLDNGYISGRKLDNSTWLITIDIHLPKADESTKLQHIKDENIYSLKE